MINLDREKTEALLATLRVGLERHPHQKFREGAACMLEQINKNIESGALDDKTPIGPTDV